MAGDPTLQLSWYLSGGVGVTDSDQSLGGARSNQKCRAWPTTISANGAAGDVRVFLVSAASVSLADSWVYFRDGNAGGWGTSVVAVDTGANWIDLLEPLPTSIAIGDSVQFFGTTLARTPYKNTTALESALGITHYCGLYCTNGGAGLSNFRFWLEAADPGDVSHEIAASNDVTHTLVTIPNETTPPDLSTLIAGGAGAFIPARSYASGSPEFTLSGANSVGFWLKRTGPVDALRRSDHAVAVVGESAGGVISKLVINWNTAGFTPLLELDHAPTVYLRGGARFKAYVRAQETGLRVVGAPVRWTQLSGPGTLTPPPEPGETDEDGISLARYAAPIDVGEIGQTFEIEASV